MILNAAVLVLNLNTVVSAGGANLTVAADSGILDDSESAGTHF